ncbi:winged helix-turn-helix domain-containing protein [Micromonospora sp. WMMD882]|uniref:winged helix-turn-helix domain-containing protein n=1 Tax=Micromonospora sp. WMMD882 TaxID=3015151 RepID=UPI00248BFFF3|nr:winged helix-turn-helix domain-containing protein [Micromonospora sp. WMMD882]WBB81157.1 winged helix-turn-helix domain-containing protein [Micromonospora sp. WMMD882]
MSVFVTSARSHPTPRLVAPPRPRPAPGLTITVDVAPGAVTPRLARLVELLNELAETGEGVLRVRGLDRAASVETLAPPTPTPPQPPAPGPARASGPQTLALSLAARDARWGSRAVGLTRIEFDLLLFLAEHPRRVFTRRQLLSGVWGHEHSVTRTVDVHVRRLRAKVGETVPLVTTVHGVGYRLADDAPVLIDREY